MDIGRPGQQQTYFRKVIRKDNDQISLDADMIRLLIAIDENKSLYQIADEVDMRADTLKLNLEKLLQQGLILQALKINLSKVIGPMSEILIEEVVSEMEITSPGIPVDQAAELIAALSHEIPDEEKRIEFKKSMMDILNKKRI
jgi:hypothetical protein